MTLQTIVVALERLEAVLRRRPQAGLHADASASATWEGGTRTRITHANGTQVHTDMPPELGGQGEWVTPGWLFRSGLASCVVTCIAFAAAQEDIELQRLEVTVGSNSDARGLLGMPAGNGATVSAGPLDVHMRVRIAARGVPAERLRALVATANVRSPVSCALQQPMPITLQVEVEAH